MKISNIGIGGSLHIFSLSDKGERIFFKSKLEEVVSDNEILVLAADISPHYTKALTFDVFSHFNFDDYMWPAKNLGLECTFEGFTVLRLRLTKVEAVVSSKREHFRVSFIEAAEILYFNEREYQSIRAHGQIINLSDGGAAFLSDTALPYGGETKLVFKLEGEELVLDVQIARCDSMPISCKHRYRYRCRWDNLNPRIEEKIARYIFNKQAKSKRGRD